MTRKTIEGDISNIWIRLTTLPGVSRGQKDCRNQCLRLDPSEHRLFEAISTLQIVFKTM